MKQAKCSQMSAECVFIAKEIKVAITKCKRVAGVGGEQHLLYRVVELR